MMRAGPHGPDDGGASELGKNGGMSDGKYGQLKCKHEKRWLQVGEMNLWILIFSTLFI